MRHSIILFTAAVTVLLLGVGCKKQPTSAPAATPAPTPTASAPTAPESGARLVAPAPTMPPPPDIPSVPSAPPTAADATSPIPLPATTAADPRVIRVIAKQWDWQPREIRVRKGERIALEITSADVPHGITIPAFNVNKTLAPGRMERVEFTATTVGRFDFACSVFCGQGHRGMRGAIVVE